MEVRKKINKKTAQVEWKVKKALRSDLPRISSFFKNQFRGYQRYGRIDMFTWKIFENTIHEGFINLIEDGDIIAATTSITPKNLLLNNKPVLAGEIGDTYVNNNYRREGLFPILGNATGKQAHDEGMLFIYGLPNNLALPGWLKRTDFLLMNNLNIRTLTFPFSAKSRFQRLFGWFLAEICDALYRIFARIYIASKKPKVDNPDLYLIKIIETIPEDWDGFWVQAAENYNFIIDRSLTSLEWRYINNPEKYSFVTVRHRNILVGYCIYRNILVESGQDTVLVDFLFLEGHENALDLCLNLVFKNSFLTSVRSLTAWCEFTSPYYDIFRRRGLKDLKDVPVIFHCKGLDDEIVKSSKVHFTIGDSDNV